MSLIDRLRSAVKATGTGPRHPDAPRAPGTGTGPTGTGPSHPDAPPAPGTGPRTAADAVQILSPATGDTWRVGQDVGVTWRLTGVTGHPCDIVLVRGDGARIEGIADLAVGVDPEDLTAWVTVPDVPPGDGYAVALTSSDPMTVYSGRLTIVR
ncbi:GPI anchored serine-threonine rich family protein [Streptomyces sp. E11-3]|uniref:GPI anchored serine-threonine rich family protein n=1 Tax=Streptomyces sp. E11-3 TaxID=3110112 RepID=UPI00397F0A6A